MGDPKLVYKDGTEYFNTSSCFAYGVLTEAKVITSDIPSLKQCKPDDSSKKKLTQEQFDYVIGQQSFYWFCTPGEGKGTEEEIRQENANININCKNLVEEREKFLQITATQQFIRPNQDREWYVGRLSDLISKYSKRLQSKQESPPNKKTRVK